jgi:hypothetical protein
MNNFYLDYSQALNIFLGLIIGCCVAFALFNPKANGNGASTANLMADYNTRAQRYHSFSELILTMVFPLSAVGILVIICVVIVTGQGSAHLAVLVALLSTALAGTGKLLMGLNPGKEAKIDSTSNSGSGGSSPNNNPIS